MLLVGNALYFDWNIFQFFLPIKSKKNTTDFEILKWIDKKWLLDKIYVSYLSGQHGMYRFYAKISKKYIENY